MSKNSTDVYGASGRLSALSFDPEALHLVDDPKHPLYDERIHLPLDEGMVLNIMDQGVIEPVVVWKDPDTGLTCVVDGRQRVRHTIEANRRLAESGKLALRVPAVPRKGSAIRMAQAMVSTNEIRRDDSPLAKAKKMVALTEMGHDDQDLALLFGCSTQTVRNTLGLLDVVQEAQDALEAGKITAGQARDLRKLKPEAQRERVEKLVDAGEGKVGRERVKAQREVVDNKPRMKTKTEILDRLVTAEGAFADALEWVLGMEEDDNA